MATLQFCKMNGAGNDFVMLDNRDGSIALQQAQIARLCDRHRGVGADGLIMVEPARGAADWRMRYYNADGGEAEMCGNGARCFTRFVHRLAPTDRPEVRFETPAGVISATLRGDLVTLGMSNPTPFNPPVALEVAGRSLEVCSINTGVPHAVVLVEDLDAVDVAATGRALRHHLHFQPRGTNVNFLQTIGPGRIAIRTYERGVEAETLACGTGVVASALTLHALTGEPSPVAVLVRGGDTLEVGFAGSPEGFHSVTLTGPADFVFEGSVAL